MTETPANPRCSLAVCTIERTSTLARLLESLAAQSYRNFELIVADQNDDDRVAVVLAPYKRRFDILHVHSARGLSRARNVALESSAGDIVAFPDDDCWYPPALLETVVRRLGEHPEWDGLTGRVIDESARPTAARWDKGPGPISPRNIFRRACSISMFLRRRLLERVGRFDESLGAGAGTPFGSGEESDYLLRALSAGCVVQYDPTLAAGHENPTAAYDAAAIARARSYGLGFGLVMARHKLPLSVKLAACLRPLAGAVLAALTGRPAKARYHLASAAGRLTGWLGLGSQ